MIDATGKAAIVYAASRGFDDIVRRLLDAGVDTRERYGNNLTALMWTAGHDEGVGASAVERVIDLLLAHGAVLDAADNRGRTALMIASALGDASTVDILMRRGADRALKDKDGKTALDLAANADVRAKLAGK
jgi:ankyrin repeat protein